MFAIVQKYAEAFAEACKLVEVAGYVWRSMLTSSKYVLFLLGNIGDVWECEEMLGTCWEMYL